MTLHRLALLSAIAVLPSVAAAQQAGHGGGFPHQAPAGRDGPRARDPGKTAGAGARQVDVRVMDYGFAPAEIPARVGETLTLIVVRLTDRTCATSLLLPGGRRIALPLDEEVRVDVELTGAGPVHLADEACDVAGAILVEPQPEALRR